MTGARPCRHKLHEFRILYYPQAVKEKTGKIRATGAMHGRESSRDRSLLLESLPLVFAYGPPIPPGGRASGRLARRDHGGVANHQTGRLMSLAFPASVRHNQFRLDAPQRPDKEHEAMCAPYCRLGMGQ